MSELPQFPGYKTELLLGAGGTAKVYRGIKEDTGEAVAIKVFHKHRVNRPDFARRFDREAALSGTLDHPGVVRLIGHAVSVDGDLYALVMELVGGETLRPRLKRGKLDPKAALVIAMQIAEILGYVHRKGVAHLDLKPENVLMVGETTVRLMDFGISQATFGQLAREGGRTAALAGTPHYMSPEQHAASPALDHRADLYALGVMLHEMLIGERPAAGVTSVGDRFPLKFRTELEGVLAKLLAHDPAQRYQTAGDVADKLKGLARTLDAEIREREEAARKTIPLPAPAPPPPPKKPAAPPPAPPRLVPDDGEPQGRVRRVLIFLWEHMWLTFTLGFIVFLIVMYNLVSMAFQY